MATQSTTFPNGQTLVSNATTAKQMDTLFQGALISALGLNPGPIQVSFTLVNGQFIATTVSTQILYQGMIIAGVGLPTFTDDNPGAVQIAEIINDTTVMLTSAAISDQALTLLTITDPSVYAKVRINWQSVGQPGFSIIDDVAFVGSEQVDSYQASIRENTNVGTTSTWTYTRTWRIHFTFYGPNGFDNARLLRSVMLLQFMHDLLAQSNIYLNPDTPSPKRNPELFDGQWFDRTDLFLTFNEFVTETITVGIGKSVEIIIENKNGIQKDFVVTTP